MQIRRSKNGYFEDNSEDLDEQDEKIKNRCFPYNLLICPTFVALSMKHPLHISSIKKNSPKKRGTGRFEGITNFGRKLIESV